MAVEFFDRFAQFAEQALAKIKVSSALNPALWLCGFAIPFGLTGAHFSAGPVQAVCLTIAAAPVALFVYAYIYFMHKSPDKLRSEEYELRKMALELIEEKGGEIPLTPSSVEAISNTEYRALPQSRGGVE